jgi:probable O-glycosylation ligase (exosortase A-associated)
MRDIAVTLLVFGSLPFILKRPWIGILVWTWLGFMNPHRLAWGFSVTFPFAMIVALTTMVAMLMSKEEKKIPWTREVSVLTLFWAWTLVTTLNAMFPQFAWDQWIKVSKILLMILVATMLINSPYRLKALVWVIALSLGFYGVKGGIFTATTGGGYQVRGPLGSFIGGNNEIGLALAMTTPLLYFLSRQTERTYVRLGLLAALGLTALAALGTQSRGAMLGMVAMTAFLWFKSRGKVITGILIVLCIAVVLPLMPQQWWDRMATINSYQQDQSAQGRINAWGMAFNLASHRLTGGGFESFQEITFELYAPDPALTADSHSIYFQVLGHHGFIGLALFLMLIVFTWLTASSIIRAARRNKETVWLSDLMAMTQVSLIAYLTAGAFLGLAYFDFFYNLVLFVVAAKVILAKHVAGVSSASVALSTAARAAEPQASTRASG